MKKLFIIRNNQTFGPYPLDVVKTYIEEGKILKCDKSYEEGNPNDFNSVRFFLKKAGIKTSIKHKGSLLIQLKHIGSELILPKSALNRKSWFADKKLLTLAVIGLLPAFLSKLMFHPFITFYTVSIYFAIIWGLFFYYLFKTNQVTIKKTVLLFFLTQVFVFIVWDIFSLPALPIINTLYSFTESSNFLLRCIGFIFGVGFLEELAKAIPLFILLKRAKEPIIPQTLVYYGLMSGIAFGVFEGVQYQMGVNSELEYGDAFFMNIARLTCLPFLHAIWAGIAGYFLSFSELYPKYRYSLILLAIAIPAILHGLYDVFGWSILGLAITLLGVALLTTYLKQGVNYQSKLNS